MEQELILLEEEQLLLVMVMTEKMIAAEKKIVVTGMKGQQAVKSQACGKLKEMNQIQTQYQD